MNRLKFLLDEDCQSRALAAAMLAHGLPVVTTNALGLTGSDDETQLRQAAAEGRTIITNNIRDFVLLHHRWLGEGLTHAGIIIFPQQGFSVSDIVRRLSRLNRTLSAEDMVNRIEWLNIWVVP